jgi:hypothetical protein
MASLRMSLQLLAALAMVCPTLASPEPEVAPAAAPADTMETATEAEPGLAAATRGSDVAASEVAQNVSTVSVASEAESPAASEAEAAPVAVNGTAQAEMGLAAIAASSAGNLRGAVAVSAGWGHGIFGETCCMCSMHMGFKTMLYAAGDYSNFFGSHNARWWCEAGCESKCHRRGGHMFGCYDEQHLLMVDREYGHRSGFVILHDEHFGNIC